MAPQKVALLQSSMPTVSIITPLHNKGEYIAATIQSVLCQTYSHWEMLVVENGSTDDSWEKAQQFQDSRIRLLRSQKQGPGVARNYGLNFATGEWILFLDADDLLEADYLEQQLIAASHHPKAEMIACGWQEFTDSNPAVSVFKQPPGFGQPIQILRDAAIAYAPWAPHSAIIKRSIIEPDCYWPEQLDQYLAEDIAFWFSLISKCSVAYSHSQGALYRMQTPQCRNQFSNIQKWFQGVHAAIQVNLQTCQNRKYSYTPGQCESLMTAYTEIYLRARRQKSVSIEQQALSIASDWLNEYFRVVKKPRIPMLVRRLLGLKLFLSLTRR